MKVLHVYWLTTFPVICVTEIPFFPVQSQYPLSVALFLNRHLPNFVFHKDPKVCGLLPAQCSCYFSWLVTPFCAIGKLVENFEVIPHLLRPKDSERGNKQNKRNRVKDNRKRWFLTRKLHSRNLSDVDTDSNDLDMHLRPILLSKSDVHLLLFLFAVKLGFIAPLIQFDSHSLFGL